MEDSGRAALHKGVRVLLTSPACSRHPVLVRLRLSSLIVCRRLSQHRRLRSHEPTTRLLHAQGVSFWRQGCHFLEALAEAAFEAKAASPLYLQFFGFATN